MHEGRDVNQCRPPMTAVLAAQLAALEAMYADERRCSEARRLLDLIHAKRDELAVERACEKDAAAIAALAARSMAHRRVIA